MNQRTILFIHQGFPGQFGSLAASLAEEGHRVLALAINPAGGLPKVTSIRHQPKRDKSADNLPPLLQDIDVKLIRAESTYEVMQGLASHGIKPDVIYAHPGWGEALFVRNVWPEARFVVYAEWFYNLKGQEVNFDPAFPPLDKDLELRLTVKNTPFLHALTDADAAITPTNWQKSRFPKWAQEKIEVVPDGLNLMELAAVLPRNLAMPSRGLKLKKGMPIVTYAARHLEPLRGFHYFMKALPQILNGNPEAHVIIMGKDAGLHNLGYGQDNPEGISWRAALQKELGNSVDWKRVHFLGMLDRRLYLAMLKLSACHVYLTAPFILSWSFLEAAALGIPIVASDTAPVREMEFLSGLFYVKFDDPNDIAQSVLKILASPRRDYQEENLKKLKNFDHRFALRRARDILLSGSQANDLGGDIESIVFEED